MRLSTSSGSRAKHRKGPLMTTTLNRRNFMTAAALTAVATSSEFAATTTVLGANSTASDEDLVGLTAVQATAAIQRGEIGAENYANALISRAVKLVDLHTYIALNKGGLIEGARAVDTLRKSGRRLGRLAGLPLL